MLTLLTEHSDFDLDFELDTENSDKSNMADKFSKSDLQEIGNILANEIKGQISRRAKGTI